MQSKIIYSSVISILPASLITVLPFNNLKRPIGFISYCSHNFFLNSCPRQYIASTSFLLRYKNYNFVNEVSQIEQGVVKMNTNYLKSVLVLKKISIYKLSKLSGINDGRLNQIINNKTKKPQITTVVKIAKALK